MATYQFYLESCEIMDTRSFHEDTIVAGLGVIVNGTVHQTTLAAQVGDHNNGKFAFWEKGLGSLDQVEIGPDDSFVFIYQLHNNGQAGRPTAGDVQAYIDRDLLSASTMLPSGIEQAALQGQIAQVEASLKQVEDQIAAIVAQTTAQTPIAAHLTKGPNIINTPADVSRLAGRRLAPAPANQQSNDQLTQLQQLESKLKVQLAALNKKVAAPFLACLLPGNDWQLEGPFDTAAYSIKNYAQGNLISIVGNIILAGCDGPLGFGIVAGTGSELDKRIPQVGPLRLSAQFKAHDLGWNAPCNPSGSNYVVNTIVQRQ